MANNSGRSITRKSIILCKIYCSGKVNKTMWVCKPCPMQNYKVTRDV